LCNPRIRRALSSPSAELPSALLVPCHAQQLEGIAVLSSETVRFGGLWRQSGELDCSVSLRVQGEALQILVLGISWATPWQQMKQYPGFLLGSTNMCPGVCCPQAEHHLGLGPCAGDASWESGRTGFTHPPEQEGWLLVPAPPTQRAAVTSRLG